MQQKKEQCNIILGETTQFSLVAAFCCLLFQILIIHWTPYTLSSLNSVKQRRGEVER